MSWLALVGFAVGLAVLVGLMKATSHSKALCLGIGGLGVTLLAIGHVWGLFFAPPEFMMGDVGRILYAHVPTAWVSLSVYLVALIAAVLTLWNGKPYWESWIVGAVEVGLVLNTLLCFQGAMWAKPTWGVYWDWDPRLTTTAILIALFGGVLILRSLVHAPDKRRMVTGVSAIIAFVNVPIVYYATTWWNSLHQGFSSPDTVSNPMHWPLRISAFGVLFLAMAFAGERARQERDKLEHEDGAPSLPQDLEKISLEGA